METADTTSTDERSSSKLFISVAIGMLVAGVITVISISGIRDSSLVIILTGIGIGISALGGCCLCCSFALQGSTAAATTATTDQQQQERNPGDINTIEQGRGGETTNQIGGSNQLLGYDSVTSNLIGQNGSHMPSGSQHHNHHSHNHHSSSSDAFQNGRPFSYVIYNALNDTEISDTAQSNLTLSGLERRLNVSQSPSHRMSERQTHSRSLSNLHTDHPPNSGSSSSNGSRHYHPLDGGVRWGSRPSRSERVLTDTTHQPPGSHHRARSPGADSPTRTMAPPPYERCTADMTEPPSYEFVMSHRSFFHT